MVRYNENLERKVTTTEDDERGSLVDIRPIWLLEHAAGENHKVMDRGLHCSWWSVQNNNEFKGTQVRVNKLCLNRSLRKSLLCSSPYHHA
ncbi:hypothetical protein IG631_02856 [Alternaria alternata]|nr:hypothetical protein IG631_02856 [Alternaria alternata]